MNDSLMLRDTTRMQLLQIKDLESGVEYLSKVKAIETWAKAEKKDAELQNMIAEQKIRTQRILGELIMAGQDAGELRKAGERDTNVRDSNVPEGNISKLSELGISRKQSMVFQQIARIPEDKFEAFIAEKKEAVNDAVAELTTAGVLRMSQNVHVSNNAGDNEWYTPSIYIESARSVMGSIDLDPASCELANKTVNADTYYDADANGLKLEWFGNIWLNPPYAQPLITEFSDKLITEIQNIDQAIVLVNNATETRWFYNLALKAMSICFPVSRIRFLDRHGLPGAPLQGQAFLYFGSNERRFIDVFNQFGFCVLCQ